MFTVQRLNILILVLLLLNYQHLSSARPYRVKRVSDQTLAELETLLGLEQLKGRVVNFPVAFGRMDPHKIGRKRASPQLLQMDTILDDLNNPKKINDEDLIINTMTSDLYVDQ